MTQPSNLSPTDRENLLVSVSGGRSSMLMAKLIKDNWSARYNLVFGFSNTGKEREETLRFVQRCDDEWDLGIIWVEAVVHGPDVACTHKVVDFHSADRLGGTFESVIAKYGIPNMNYLHCTRELKANPLRSLCQMFGWKKWKIAQGMRADEPRRTKPKPNVIYPLASEWPMDKADVLNWWKGQKFDLGLKDHQGNCDGCHKKHITKLVRIAQESPQTFDWWGDMERRYGLAGNNIDGTPRTFYRGRRSAKDILKMSRMMILPPLPDEEDDAGCSESCEPDFSEVFNESK